MNARQALSVSVIANIALLGLLAVLDHRPDPHFLPTDPAPTPAATVASTPPSSQTLRNSEPSPVTHLQAHPDFNWNWFDQAKLERYVDQLRQAECPFPTLCDIIVGVIQRQYAPRIQNARTGATPFWKTQRRPTPADIEARRQRLQLASALEQERDQLVRKLLGVEYATLTRTYTQKEDTWNGILSRIGEPERREQVREILSRFDERREGIYEASGGTLGQNDEASLKALFREQVQELQTKLSAAELEDFQLRNSPIAQELRTRLLVGFEPSEEEFRALFRIHNASDTSIVEHPRSTTDVVDAAIALEARNAQVREALGDSRYAEYLRAQDLTFQRLIETTDYLGLPTSAAIRVYDTREQMLVQLRELDAASGLSAQQRQSHLQEIRSQVENSVVGALGPEGYRNYANAPWGRWLQEIEP